MSIQLTYEGPVVTENKRLVPARGRLVPNGKYKKFKQDMAVVFKSQTAIRNIKDFNIEIYIYCNNRIDAHNLIKPIMDSLQDADIIQNDKDCSILHLVKGSNKGSKDTLILLMIFYKE